jgi:hypothetical protein
VTDFVDIVDFIEKKFKVKSEHEMSSNLLLLRLPGIDNVSLGRYIKDLYSDVKVTTREIEGYKILTNGWIKIEKNVVS